MSSNKQRLKVFDWREINVLVNCWFSSQAKIGSFIIETLSSSYSEVLAGHQLGFTSFWSILIGVKFGGSLLLQHLNTQVTLGCMANHMTHSLQSVGSYQKRRFQIPTTWTCGWNWTVNSNRAATLKIFISTFQRWSVTRVGLWHCSRGIYFWVGHLGVQESVPRDNWSNVGLKVCWIWSFMWNDLILHNIIVWTISIKNQTH